MDKIKILEKDLESISNMIGVLTHMESGVLTFPNGAGIDRTKSIKELLWIEYQIVNMLKLARTEQKEIKTSDEKKG